MPRKATDQRPSSAQDEDAEFAHHIALSMEYEARFDRIAPVPAMVDFRAVTREMAKALKRGKPIAHNHDWYRHLPPGAVA